MFGAVITNNTQQTTQPVNTAAEWNKFYENLFAKRPDLLKKFRSKKLGFFLDIIYNKNLSPVQKFEKLFDVKAIDINQIALSGLGDIFEEISNFFSNENLRKIENGIRQGQQISNSIANGLNALRNQGNQNTANDITEIRDQQSKLYFSANSYLEKYGTPMLIGAGALILILLFKK